MADKKTKQNPIERLLAVADSFQRRHKIIGFPYAVVKKFGDDEAGHQAALVTYYGFLSLFPLLIVATSVADIVAQRNAHLRENILNAVDKYFPSFFGEQLQNNVHGNSKTGIALILGTVVAFYGARGIADALRGVLDHAWGTPKAKRSGFPKNVLKSLGLLTGAGLGLVVTTGLTGLATSAVGHNLWLRFLPIILNIGLLYLIFMYVFMIGTSRSHPRKDLRLGALTTAVGLLILQTAGLALVQHQLTNLQGLYGQFALVLAMLFWIYLQAQVVVYAIEINVVHAYKLWPRSLSGKNLTNADEKAYSLYAKKEAMKPAPEEEIKVTFNSKK